jgi:hypothetical protein
LASTYALTDPSQDTGLLPKPVAADLSFPRHPVPLFSISLVTTPPRSGQACRRADNLVIQWYCVLVGGDRQAVARIQFAFRDAPSTAAGPSHGLGEPSS